MDLITAKVEAASASKGGKKVFINVDKDGECTLGKFDPQASTVCYSNGSQIPMPKDEPEEVKQKKTVKKVKTKAKKTVAKKKAAKKDRKPIEGKKMKISVAKALTLAKKGASIYRASNGSPFGAYYLSKVANKDREMELIVKQ
jgi:hypothetical protein